MSKFQICKLLCVSMFLLSLCNSNEIEILIEHNFEDKEYEKPGVFEKMALEGLLKCIKNHEPKLSYDDLFLIADGLCNINHEYTYIKKVFNEDKCKELEPVKNYEDKKEIKEFKQSKKEVANKSEKLAKLETLKKLKELEKKIAEKNEEPKENIELEKIRSELNFLELEIVKIFNVFFKIGELPHLNTDNIELNLKPMIQEDVDEHKLLDHVYRKKLKSINFCKQKKHYGQLIISDYNNCAASESIIEMFKYILGEFELRTTFNISDDNIKNFKTQILDRNEISLNITRKINQKVESEDNQEVEPEFDVEFELHKTKEKEEQNEPREKNEQENLNNLKENNELKESIEKNKQNALEEPEITENQNTQQLTENLIL